ncbi:MAG: glycosyltransferase family 2 protein [Acidobacteria bacterium]|nr:glycosyltransferase family 2 protein [Acidobacteriota bacterium]
MEFVTHHSSPTTHHTSPSISVIIPTFNRKARVLQAIASVLAQTRRPDEVIVVDDGSTDGSAGEIQREFPTVIVIRQENCGVSVARNTGIRAATGNWLTFLDSDDKWKPEKLKKQLTYVMAHPVFRVSQTDEVWIRNGSFVNPMKKHEKRGGWFFRDALKLCLVSPSAVMIRSDVFRDIGFFDETLPACEDYDLWLRILAREPIGFLAEKLVVKYGGHPDQLSRNFIAMDRFRVRAILKILRFAKLSAKDRKAAITELAEKCRILEQGYAKHGFPEKSARFRRIRENVTGKLDRKA